MKALSNKVSGIASSATLEIADRAKAMARQGIDVISLSIGEPDFDTPQHIRDACCESIRRGDTHYAPSRGIPELLQAIAGKIQAENRFPCSPEQVIATAGAKHAIAMAMEACLNPNDEVILLDPAWVSYEPCVQLAGGRVVHHQVNPKTFQPDDTLLDRVTGRTKMIVVNSPNNPTGAVFDKRALELVADLCTDYELLAMSDEIYEKLIYGKEHISLASIGDMAGSTITINGFSKAYAMTGWRLGYAVAPVEVIRQMTKVQQHGVTHPATFVMWAGVTALTGDQAPVQAMKQEFENRRNYLMDEFAQMKVQMAPADGAFYAFINARGDDVEVSEHWLNKAHVAVTPGTAFYAPGWIRISYATAMPRLKEAMARIKKVWNEAPDPKGRRGEL
ncbi:MAG TPA: pyridoxal phosphate-dependent aminotransferase [Methanomicrobiales archaeon]|nr:pyridoxal phosphate-dependent aminotransferase [Methanomicrobiales archaeon]